MFKHIALLVRQDDMTHEEFVDYWQNNHTPIARDIEGVVRYQTVLPTDPENAEFDGLAELYFETLDDLHEALGSEGSRDYDPTREVAAKAREDVNNFLDIERRPRFIGEEKIWKDEVAGDTDGLYKHSAFLVRKDGMTHEEFRDYWENNHSPLAKDIEGVVRYQTVYPTDPENAEFDGVAELYFETLDDLHEALGSEGSRDYDPTREVAAKARADVDNFLAVEKRPRFIGKERLVKNDLGDVEGY
ncbi:EthD domain-containing protein [Haloarchaeobius sp. HME9146]|uniref:EthD domain-containing protein n=1 Tax=Haloarchaeobius sp. HME9146 TaxID=2978732 RepID=UPI0021C12E30|nr:EthD domain-containing protein [Haloarchaeobius sp. HME9146]MCT9096728.1 EthD family reductase [Haloarchaeobius sp. HME9146]